MAFVIFAQICNYNPDAIKTIKQKPEGDKTITMYLKKLFTQIIR